jgi:D-lactate dehydrogenase
MTPRQRIVVQREIAGGYADSSVLDAFQYDGIETCATDGLCEIACPVNINTGTFVKSFRQKNESTIGRLISVWAANHFSFIQFLARGGLTMGKATEKIFGGTALKVITRFLNKIGLSPQWNEKLPYASKPIHASKENHGAQWVYFPSCLTRVFSSNDQQTSLANILTDISDKAGISLQIPPEINSTCCSQPFASKGYHDAANSIQEKTIELLWEASNNGEFPILIDTSPCTYQMLHPNVVLRPEVQAQLNQLNMVDIIEFLAICVEKMDKPKLNREIVLHPTCSTEKMGQVAIMKSLAEKCTEKVTIPIHWGCCAFAGDRGLIVPELNESATAMELSDIKGYKTGYSTSRTCEVGMMSHSSINYQSIAFLVKEYLNQPVN